MRTQIAIIVILSLLNLAFWIAGCPGNDDEVEQSETCAALIECETAVAPTEVDGSLDTYGPDGTCWVSEEQAEACTAACAQALEDYRAEYPDETACESVGDDDDVDPNAPVLSELDVSYGGGASNCRVFVEWIWDDADGDYNGGTINYSLDGDPGNFVWNLESDGEIFHYDVGIEFIVGVSLDEPALTAESTYDIEVWMTDGAGNESNHLVEEGFETPNTECGF